MSEDLNKALEDLSNKNPSNKYYVYRLIDPRTFQTFYVGKGCGNRVLQHVKNVRSLLSNDEDLVSLKAQQIGDIIASGKEVIMVLHRRGLTEKEAFEVEAALIDAYPSLTNIQSGHDVDRGLISVDDYYQMYNTPVYSEPAEDYVIIKVTNEMVQTRGSLYEAVRQWWKADINRAKGYKYVLAVINGIVREVYETQNWYKVDDRIAFEGKVATGPISSLKGKKIPQEYRQKGAANPFMYKK